MDVPLYAIALAIFAVLYLGIGVFLLYTIVITLLIMMLYLTLRYSPMPEGYPHSAGDVKITSIFIGITWGIFSFLGPKPIPFVGSGLLYTAPTSVIYDSILAIGVIVSLGFLAVFSVAVAKLGREPGAGEASAGGGEKPKQGVGA